MTLCVAEPDLVVIRGQIEHGADQLAEAIVNRPHGLVDHARHGGSGLGEFVHHQPEMPAGAIGPANSLEHGVDQFAKSLFRRSRAARSPVLMIPFPDAPTECRRTSVYSSSLSPKW